MSQKHIVFVGGGHANIQVLKHLYLNPIKDTKITLVSNALFAPYSGMLPAHLAGWYDHSEIHFDLKKICQDTKVVDFIHDEVVDIDPDNQTIKLKNTDDITYDYALINVGITPKPFPNLTTQKDNYFPLKPISQFLDYWGSFTHKAKAWDKKTPIHVSFVGAGPSGVEVAVIAALLLKKLNLNYKVELFQRSDQLMKGHHKRVQKKVEKMLERHNVSLKTNKEANGFDGEYLAFTDGKKAKTDFVFGATQAMAPQWLKKSLPVSQDNFLKVNKYLQVEGFKNLFAAGDCISFCGKSLPKAGVFAVRQGPILSQNISALINEKALTEYVPQSKTLALITSGEKRALVSYGPFNFEGSWVWMWKDYIDKDFMKRFQKF